jgi:uncharacterized protein (DUF427 family)
MTDALPEENVQEYPRPPRLEAVPQRVRIVLGGQVIVDTDRALRVLETHHAPTYYIPPDAISAKLTPAGGGSFCEWKGSAAYWDVSAGGATARGAAWSYPSPSGGFAALTDHLAFYASRMEACSVGGVEATAQPGDFYGGWVTPNLAGRIKGPPGTRHW